MSANKFVLKHKHIEVEYTVGITPGLTALSYNDGSTTQKFTSSEVTVVDETGSGQLVSVALIKTIDAGGERFGFFLPNQLDVPQGQTTTFHTVGVYWKFGGPDFKKVPSWRCVELEGKAQSVKVQQ